MEQEKRIIYFENFLIIFSAYFVGLLFFLLTLASLSFFYPIIVYASFLFFCGILFFRFKNIQIKVSKNDFAAMLLIFFLVFLSVFFVHESFSSVDDSGVYSTSAIYLTRHHTLRVYETINLRGFIDRNGYAIPQFYSGYIVFLAFFYLFGGIYGILLANTVPLFIGLFALYAIARKLFDHSAGIWTIALLGTFYPIIWFSRITLTETFSFFLFWIALFAVQQFHTEKQKFFLYSSFVLLWYLAFTRPEGIVIMTFFYLFLFLTQIFEKRKIFDKNIVLFSISILFLFFIYTFFAQSYYHDTLLQLMGWLAGRAGSKSPDDLLGILPPDSLKRMFPVFTLWVLNQYNFLIFFFMGILGFLYEILRPERRWHSSVIIFSSVMVFWYLAYPAIALVQPWMLRRFVMIIFPFFILFSVIFLHAICHHRRMHRKYWIFLVLLLTNIYIASPILFFPVNRGIYEQTKNIASFLPSQRIIFFRSYAFEEAYIDSLLYAKFNKHMYSVGGINDFWNQFSKIPEREVYFLTSDRYNYSKEIELMTTSLPIQVFLEKKSTLSFQNIKITGLIPGSNLPSGSWQDQVSYFHAKQLSTVPKEINKKQFNVFLYRIVKNEF